MPDWVVIARDDPVRYSCYRMSDNAGRRARARGLPHDLTIDYLVSIAPERCPVFGWKLKYGTGARQIYSASLDRIIPEHGYVQGNVQIISTLANSMKQDACEEELKKFAEWILNES